LKSNALNFDSDTGSARMNLSVGELRLLRPYVFPSNSEPIKLFQPPVLFKPTLINSNCDKQSTSLLLQLPPEILLIIFIEQSDFEAYSNWYLTCQQVRNFLLNPMFLKLAEKRFLKITSLQASSIYKYDNYIERSVCSQFGKKIEKTEREYDACTKLIFMTIDDKLHGVRCMYNDNFSTVVEHYSHGKKLYTEELDYYENGHIQHIVSHYMEKRSSFHRYYKNGNLKYICYYFRDKQHGEEREYYKNGNLGLIRYYFRDKKHGEEREYHENGNLKLICCWVRDQKHGEEREYHENGNLRHICYWNRHKPRGRELKYDSGGYLQVIIRWYKGIKLGERHI
jgi:antitoxin component YwqK of YwqJK toxin-antitoxin module